MNGKFYNCVDFDVHFRATWLPNNPAIKLPPNGIIEGPFDKLIGFRFLRPIQQRNMQRVSPIIETPSMKEDVKQQMEWRDKYQNSYLNDDGDVIEIDEDAEVVAEDKLDLSDLNLPFDPMNVNWVKTSVDDLETAANILKIDLTESNKMKPKDRRWHIVKLIKEAVGRK